MKYPAVETTPLTEREKAVMNIAFGNPGENIESMSYDINDDGTRTCYVKFEESNCFNDFSDVFTLAFGRRLIDDFLEYPAPKLEPIQIKPKKRSEWMKGLLEAEELYKDGWSVDAIRSEFFRTTSDERSNGAYEYCWFKQYSRGKGSV